MHAGCGLCREECGCPLDRSELIAVRKEGAEDAFEWLGEGRGGDTDVILDRLGVFRWGDEVDVECWWGVGESG